MEILNYYLRKVDEKHTLIDRTDSKGSSVLMIVSFLSSASMVVLFKIDVAWEQCLFACLYCAALLSILILDIFKVILPRVKPEILSKEQLGSTQDILKNTYLEIEHLDGILSKKNKYLSVVFVILVIMILTLIASTICAII